MERSVEDSREVDHGVVVRSVRIEDGEWRAWLVRGDLPLRSGRDQELLFCAPSRSESERKAVNWFRSRRATLVYWKTDAEWIVH